VGDRVIARVGTHILPYFGYNSHELVSRNGALPWHHGVGYIEGRVLIDLHL